MLKLASAVDFRRPVSVANSIGSSIIPYEKEQGILSKHIREFLFKEQGSRGWRAAALDIDGVCVRQLAMRGVPLAGPFKHFDPLSVTLVVRLPA